MLEGTMKVLHILSAFHPAQGFGVARYVSELGKASLRLGHEVHVLSTHPKSDGKKEGHLDGLTLHALTSTYPFFAYNETLQAVLYNLPLCQRLIEIWESHGPFELVSPHDWTGGMVAAVAQRLFGIPLIATVHGTQVGRIGGKGAKEDIYVADMERWMAQRANRIIVPGEFVRSEVVKHYLVPQEKVIVVPEAVRAEAFNADVDLPEFRGMFAEPDETLVACVGRLAPEKGPDILIEAMREVLRTCPKTRLVLAGDGPMREWLTAELERRALSQKVRITGHLGTKVLGALYQAADVLVVPSRYEGGGMAVLEGLVHGLPIVAAHVGGIAEIARRLNGGLLRPAPADDPKGLARVLIEQLRSGLPKGRDPHPIQSRIPREASWEEVAKATQDIWESSVLSTVA
jgi:glycosyltransferase involved in cell wall biosynthesis